nr:hypothetical protein CFP56_08784 [Quercus suber]
MCIIQKISKKLLKQLRALGRMLPLLQLHLSSFQPPRPLFLLLRLPKGLARLVTKAKGGSGQETKGPKVDRGKEATPKIKESKLVKSHVVAQEKKATFGKAANPSVSQPASKKDPPLAKA